MKGFKLTCAPFLLVLLAVPASGQVLTGTLTGQVWSA